MGFSRQHVSSQRFLTGWWLCGGQQWQDPCFDLVSGEGFTDVALGTGCDGAEDEGLAAFGGDHDGWDSGREFFAAAGLEELEAVHHGHVNVADDEGERAGCAAFVTKCLEGLFAVGGLQDLGEIKASLAKRSFDYFSHDCRIINN